jgi:hypothetical protein
MKQAVRFALHKCSGFLPIDHIVRDTRHFGGELRSGGETFESADSKHEGREEKL